MMSGGPRLISAVSYNNAGLKNVQNAHFKELYPVGDILGVCSEGKGSLGQLQWRI